MHVLRVLLILIGISYSTDIFTQSLPTDELIDTVYCQHDTTQSYALYLPPQYTPQPSLPIIFIFEPSARGRLPVSKFLPAARELGYILMCSNNSRNGSWDISFSAAEAMFTDALSQYKIDTSRMYTSGFSGGSRVATSVAVLTGKVAGIVACGAGYPNVEEYRPKLGSDLVYFALVGNKDMNYQEHLIVKDDLDKKNIANNLLVFPAGHQWPQTHYLKEALYWLELQAMKNERKVSDSFELESAYNYSLARIDSVIQAGDLANGAEFLEKLAFDYQDLVDTQPVEAKIAEIKGQKTYLKQVKAKEKINALEMEHRFKWGEAFTELIFTRFMPTGDSTRKSRAWWNGEIDKLRRMTTSKDTYKSHMAYRLLNMIWARCAETSFSYAAQGDFEIALILNDIWLYVEPKSIWGHWSMAQLYAQTGNVENAISHLRIIKEQRPAIPARVFLDDKAISQIVGTPQFQAFLKSF